MTDHLSPGTPFDAETHQPVILREDDVGDGLVLTRLRADPTVEVIDQRDSTIRQLSRVWPAPTTTELAESGRWVFYPWRRTLVSVLGPRAFRRLRLDRNRNKITLAEQAELGRLTIGVVGLSVGHAIAHTLALEGLCGRLRLADFDTIELSNLNRIPASIFDLGVNKAIVTARRIAELDPYLPVDVFTGGLTEQSMAPFLDGLDLVIEECDSLDVKVRVRQEARARGIPVLMETSDRGLFDIERFDLEPGRPLFHGLLGALDPDNLQGLSTRDKAPYVMRILEAPKLSARIAASMVEIDRTVSTWPQLGGDVQLGAATTAAAVRRFGRGDTLPSGRIRVDLDGHFDELGAESLVDSAELGPAMPDSPVLDSPVPDSEVPDSSGPDSVPDSLGPDSAGPDSAGPDSAVRDSAVPDSAVPDSPALGSSALGPLGLDHSATESSAVVDLTLEVPPDAVGAVIHAIRLGPSGGNSQPWSISVAADRVDIRLAAERTSAMDVRFRGSYVAIGAAGLNARMAAAEHEMLGPIVEFPEGPGSDPVLSVALAKGTDRLLAAQYPAMIERISNRNFGRRSALGDRAATELAQAAEAEGGKLRLVTERDQLARLADVLAESDRLRYLTPLLHQQLMSELKWPGRDRLDLGIDIRTLGLDSVDLVKLEVASRPDVMALLATWGGGYSLGDGTRDRVNASSALAIITVGGDTPRDYLHGGAAAERVWVCATRHRLGVQPISPVFLYARDDRDRRALSADFAAELAGLQERFERIVALDDGEVPVLVLRISHDAGSAVRSARLPLAEILSVADTRGGQVRR